MLPFIGSIKSNCCSILIRKETSREDLEGGILTIVGLTMANRNNANKQLSKEPGDKDPMRLLIDNGTDNVDSNVIRSDEDILHFRRTLAQSAESLYPFGIEHLQSSSTRRLSHNFNSERRRSLLWARPTTEELMARASRRTSEEPKSQHSAKFDPIRGLTLINLSNLLIANF